MTLSEGDTGNRHGEGQQLALAAAEGEKLTTLRKPLELIGYFQETFERVLGPGYEVVAAGGAGPTVIAVGLGPRAQRVDVEYIRVEGVPTIEDHDVTIPYLVMKGKDEEGDCVTTAVPVVQDEGTGLFYAVADVKREAVLRPLQDDPGGGGGTCDYSHSCQGDPCNGCRLFVSSNGCYGNCDCRDDLLDDDPNEGGFCNHTASTN